MSAALTERYDPARHDVLDFASGNEALDRWLQRYAGQGERRDGDRTFVAIGEGKWCVATTLCGPAKLSTRRRPRRFARASRVTFRSRWRFLPASRSMHAARGGDLACACSTMRLSGYAELRRRLPC